MGFLMLTSRNWGEVRRWGGLWITQAIILFLCNRVCVYMHTYVGVRSVILHYFAL